MENQAKPKEENWKTIQHRLARRAKMVFTPIKEIIIPGNIVTLPSGRKYIIQGNGAWVRIKDD